MSLKSFRWADTAAMETTLLPGLAKSELKFLDIPLCELTAWNFLTSAYHFSFLLEHFLFGLSNCFF